MQVMYIVEKFQEQMCKREENKITRHHNYADRHCFHVGEHL